MINVNYQKRKNLELFKCLEKPETLFLSKTQNYIPIYNKFFTLNDSNYNNINLNNKWYISNVAETDEYNCHLFNCTLKNLVNNKSKDKEVFFKMAPLLDPFKYLIGKYNQQVCNGGHYQYYSNGYASGEGGCESDHGNNNAMHDILLSYFLRVETLKKFEWYDELKDILEKFLKFNIDTEEYYNDMFKSE